MRLTIHLLLLIIVSQFTCLSFAKKNTKKKFYEGYKVEFDYQNYPHEREIAYQWYLDKESKYLTGMTKDDIGIDFYDIDNDGVKEMLVYINGGDYCPTAGCPFTILRITENADKKYQPIKGLESFASSTLDIKLLKSCTLGWHDIMFGENRRFSVIWKWNGKQYF